MKRILIGLTAASALFFGGAALAEGVGPEANNWYVCKYVSTPITSEVVQTGQNPIFTDENSIDPGADGVVGIGDAFSDAQGGSVVVSGPFAPNDKPDPEPGVEVCPTSTPPTTTTVTPPGDDPPTTTVSPPPVTTTTTAPPVTSTTTAPPTTTSPTGPTHTSPSESPEETPPPNSPSDSGPKGPSNQPDKLAFTGPEDVVPIAGAALALLTLGSGLLWRARKTN